MREIKFRGKSRNDGRWLYGDLIHNAFDGTYEWSVGIKEDGLYPEPIIEGTESQFTGLHDKNGKEIYEGDILEYYTKFFGNLKRHDLEVRWSHDIDNDSFGEPFTAGYCFSGFDWAIIGNIHENQELLK